MAQQKRQDITTGNGSINPILAGSDHTAGVSKPSRTSTSTAAETTKTVSIPEGLSQLQTLAVDLRGLGCEVSILAKGRMVYFVAKVPASIENMSMAKGHIMVGSQPVSNIEVKK